MQASSGLISSMASRPCSIVWILLVLAAPVANAESIDVTIHRDEWGVPHVYGPTDASVVYGFVTAQAEDNFWQVEDSLIQSIGRYAEVNGEAALGADWLNRALRIVEVSKAEWAALPPDARMLTEAAADALNDYVKRTGIKPRVIEQFEPWHFTAFSRFSVYQLFIFNRTGIKPDEIAAFANSTRSQDVSAGLSRRNFGVGTLAAATDSLLADAQTQAGSNTWAIAPSRTRTGGATLFINPHQPYFGPGQWYEGHLHSDEGLEFSGAGFFGSPLPTIGHNRHLGWSHTVNTPDVVDVYRLAVNDTSAPTDYAWDGGRRELTTWRDSIRVRTDAGIETREFTFRRSHHGPVVAVRNGEALAVKLAKFDEGGQLEQRYAMLKASTLAEFKSALGQLASPMFNTMYADDQGNIFYAYYGAVPKRRDDIDWAAPVDGADPANEWQGYHPLEELPTLTNPAPGYLQNCNATPFMATGDGHNPDATKYPRYMAPEPDNNRSRNSRFLLGGKQRFGFNDITRMTFDARVIEADTMLPNLLVEAATRDLSKPDFERINEAVIILMKWDRQADADSKAMSLYYQWRFVMTQKGVTDPVKALFQAMDELTAAHGSWQVKWGELNRLQRRHTSGLAGFDDTAPSIGVGGGPGDPLGTIFNVYARPVPGQKRLYAVAGHSYVSLVDFGKVDDARSLLVFGASADPASRHYFDQAKLFQGRNYKRAWFKREDVVKAAVSTLQLQWSPR